MLRFLFFLKILPSSFACTSQVHQPSNIKFSDFEAKYKSSTPDFWWYPKVSETNDQSKDYSKVLATQRPTNLTAANKIIDNEVN